MKVPVPAINDPSYDAFVKSLAKHDVSVEEYRTIYKNSSIPPNNNLSTLAIKILETNASFVTEYKKYEVQLRDIVQQHVQNRNIAEAEDGLFIITNRAAFPHQFHQIENLVPSNRQEKSRGKLAELKDVTECSLK